MNAIVCFETITAFVFGFCLLCESTLESTLTRGPNDTSIILGDNVKLECFAADKNYPPAWSYLKAGSGEKKDISLVYKQGDLIAPRLMPGYGERHSIVGDRSTGEYSLRITDAKPEDAGTYTCTARGGLSSSEKRSADLSVVEPFPECASNITDVVDENDCHKEPDVVGFTCKFRVHGKYLPEITWTLADNLKKVIITNTPTTEDSGMVSSKMNIKANYVGLDTTHFRCIISSTEEAEDSRVTCVTPKINVLKISDLSESKTLEAPEEVECSKCIGWSKLNPSGCEWRRRDYDDNGHQQETLVTSNTMLNLHRDDMTPGTYTCVANCKIRGELCKVKLLEVSYKPSGSEPVQSTNVIVASVVSVLGVVLLVGVAILIFFICFRKWYKDKRRSKTSESPASSDRLQNQPSTPLLHSNRPSIELRNGVAVPVNVADGEATNTPLAGSDSSVDSGTGSLPAQQSTPPSSQDTPLTGSDSSLPSQQSTSSSQESRNDVAVDIPDAKLGGLTKSERIRLIEERAEARMRANVARQSGENNQAFSPDTDVAEGVAADKKKHE